MTHAIHGITNIVPQYTIDASKYDTTAFNHNLADNSQFYNWKPHQFIKIITKTVEIVINIESNSI